MNILTLFRGHPRIPASCTARDKCCWWNTTVWLWKVSQLNLASRDNTMFCAESLQCFRPRACTSNCPAGVVLSGHGRDENSFRPALRWMLRHGGRTVQSFPPRRLGDLYLRALGTNCICCGLWIPRCTWCILALTHYINIGAVARAVPVRGRCLSLAVHLLI